jgi:hypothetical protein
MAIKKLPLLVLHALYLGAVAISPRIGLRAGEKRQVRQFVAEVIGALGVTFGREIHALELVTDEIRDGPTEPP